MGNWRTVRIVGTCAKHEIPVLHDALDLRDALSSIKKFHCLGNAGGLCGLPNWVDEKIDVVGNLAERDYSVEAVAKQLEKLSKIAPSLEVKIHCGGDYESTTCINTIILKDGVVLIGKPEVESVGEIHKSQIEANLIYMSLVNMLNRGNRQQ